MNGISTVILVGNLTRDADVRESKNGTKYARCTIAMNYDKGMGTNEDRSVDYFNLTLWGKSAEMAERYFRRGLLLYVEGEIHFRKYKTREGVEKEANDVTVRAFRMLSRPRDEYGADQDSPQGGAVTAAPRTATPFGEEPPAGYEDIPF